MTVSTPAPTREQLLALAGAFAEAVNRHHLAGLDDVVAPDIIEHEAMPGEANGRDGLVASFSALFEAFPDYRVELDEVLVDGDRLIMRATISGTQLGALMGLAATGRKMSIGSIDIARVEDGRIVEHWGQSDQLGMATQLGLLAGSGSTG